MSEVYMVYYTKDCEVYGKKIKVKEGETLEEVIKKQIPNHTTVNRVVKA